MPDNVSDFKDKFKSTINNLLEKDSLPGIDSIAGYRPLCAQGSAYSTEEISRRDQFLDNLFNCLKKIKTAKA